MSASSAIAVSLPGQSSQPDAQSSARRATGRSRRVAADIVALLDVAAVVLGGLLPSHIYALTETWHGNGTHHSGAMGACCLQ